MIHRKLKTHTNCSIIARSQMINTHEICIKSKDKKTISNQSVSFRGLKNIILRQKSEIVSNSLKNKILVKWSQKWFLNEYLLC